MEIAIKGKHVDVGDALRGHAETQLNNAVTKYFERAINANVIFSKEGHGFRCDISAHTGRGMVTQGGGTGKDAYAAFDGALDRIAKQLRRYKSRIRNHHRSSDDAEILAAQYAILAPEHETEELPEEGQPAIVAEMPHEIATLTVSEAVMRMDLADTPAMMFRNRGHGGLNVVYRRTDGNVGWIDPANADKS